MTDAANGDDALEKWHHFLCTPPNWDHSSTENREVSEFRDYLPAALFDDMDRCPSPASNSGSDSSEMSPVSFPSIEYFDMRRECETLSLLLTNLDPSTTATDLADLLESYGEIESIDFPVPRSGLATVRFYDIRASQAARRSVFYLQDRCLGIGSAPPIEILNPQKPPNNGTIVVFHLRQKVSDESLHQEFSPFGEIREIRSAPGKTTQRFIEYYDLRAAEAAVKGMKGKKICKSRISVEFSLPGGFKKNQKQAPSPQLPRVERAPRTQTPFVISY
jgi:RNA recognition motif-containing protein